MTATLVDTHATKSDSALLITEADDNLLLGMTRAGLRCLGILSVFDAALVTQIAAFLRLALALRRLAVLVHLFLDELRIVRHFSRGNTDRSGGVSDNDCRMD
jgi:hypothetical protein